MRVGELMSQHWIDIGAGTGAVDESQNPRAQPSPARSLSGYRPDVREVDEPEHESTRRLLRFWQEKSSSGQLLKRSEIPAREIRSLMANVFLAAPVDPQMSDWCFRLAGENLYARFGGAPVGQKLSESHDRERFTESLKSFQRIVRTLKPRIMRGRFLGLARDFYEVEIVHLPIIGDEKGTIWILGGIFFFN